MTTVQPLASANGYQGNRIFAINRVGPDADEKLAFAAPDLQRQ